MKRIGIFGGTFDPIHNGHIGLAEDVREQAQLDEVIFIPAKLQPFKLDKQVTDGKHRLAMVRLAISDIQGFWASDYELRQEEISYTYLTLRAIAREAGEDARLCFINGTDTFLKIYKWNHAEELLRNYSFAVGSRPGYKDAELEKCIEYLKTVYNTDIIKVRNRKRDISATEIRSRIEEGKTLKGLVPEQVERYIKANGLY